MPQILRAVGTARGSLVVDPKEFQQAWGQPAKAPLRRLAWDEDATTLVLEAARAADVHAWAGRLRYLLVPPGVDAATVRVALGIAPEVQLIPSSSDETAGALAARLDAPALALSTRLPAHPLATEGDASARAAVYGPAEPGAPAPVDREAHVPTLAVSAARALQESRWLAPDERIPDSPMGAYVPMGTWVEDLPARLRLLAQRCVACGRTLYPPRGACPACRGRSFTDAPLPEEALVYAATRIGRGGAPSEFALEQAQTGAYWVAVVEWPEQSVRVSARLAGFDERGPAIGARVRPVVRRLFEQEGAARYGVKFAPADSSR